MIHLRTHQQNAVNAIGTVLEDNDRCLVKMFCGTGKTRIVFYIMMNNNNNLSVIVFPSISLITQFNIDYIQNKQWNDITKRYSYLSICSKNELSENTHNITYTTDPDRIRDFIETDQMKIICVTYQSLEVFINALDATETEIDMIVYDEAHHIVGSKIQDLVFNNDSFKERCIKTIFLTATPKNENGIMMLDRNYDDFNYELDDEDDCDDDEDDLDLSDYNADCGVLAYEYTHYQAVQDGICNDFDIAIDFYTDKSYKYKSTYNAIARCIFSTGNEKCLTFHSRAEISRDEGSTVIDFISKNNQKKFKEEYNSVLINEFSSLTGKYKNKLVINGLTGRSSNKISILNTFEKDTANVHVLASCNTIGEGMDTKNANIVCFVDPKSSQTMIIQNIGRVCRKQAKNSTILLPCYVDKDKYINCKTDEERDKVIREDMNETGNFTNILNVLSALKHDDPELYDLSLRYPNKFAPKEIQSNLNKQGYKIEKEVGNIHDTIQSICNLSDGDTKKLKHTTDLKDISDIIGKKIELHTDDMSEPIKVIGKDYNDVVRLYHIDGKYRVISETENATETITKPNRKKVNINIHDNADINVLWGLQTNIDLNRKICQVYIESSIKDDKWEIQLNNVEDWIRKNNRKPSRTSTDKVEKELGYWVSKQTRNYIKNIGLMRCANISQKWKEFVNKYEDLLMNNNERWSHNLGCLCEYIVSNGKRPSHLSKNIKEKNLARWTSNQIKNYNENKKSMNDINKRNKWEEFINKYNKFMMNSNEIWHENLKLSCVWIDKYMKRPSSMSKNIEERKIGQWIKSQDKNYRNNQMKNDNIRLRWEEFKEKYNNYMINDIEKWYKNYDNSCKWIDENKEIPHEDSEDKEVKMLSKWILDQKYNYNRYTASMGNDRRKKWEEFMQKYNEFLIRDNKWCKNLEQAYRWIDKYNKKPSTMSEDDEEKKISIWISRQIENNNKRIGFTKYDDRLSKWNEFTKKYNYIIMNEDRKWYEKLNKLYEWIEINNRKPRPSSTDEEEKKLCVWISKQIANYNKNIKALGDKNKREKWEEFTYKYNKFFMSDDERWYENLKLSYEWIDKYHKRPSSIGKNSEEKRLGTWIVAQIQNYKKNIKSMKDDINKQKIWKKFIDKYPKIFDTSFLDKDEPKPTKSIATNDKESSPTNIEIKKKIKIKIKKIPKSKISELHKKYKVMSSSNLHELFNSQPELWKEYHEISDKNEEGFIEKDEIPYKRIIRYLDNAKFAGKKYIADLGCGKARIAKYFDGNDKFEIHSFDHYTIDEPVVICDIKSVPISDYCMDIAILCLSMWGSNCNDYIKEANRILGHNGILLIIEPTKRWVEDDGTNRLEKLLIDNNFWIKKIHNKDKFMFIEALKD